ncbi:MAG: hypothetical protein HUJ54_15230, partial [Erysipelotrichaceae bacterium]|nr:hypothetical protein [Erysipelotrichaceae bacterium]
MREKILKFLISTALLVPIGFTAVHADSDSAKTEPAGQTEKSALAGVTNSAEAKEDLKEESAKKDEPDAADQKSALEDSEAPWTWPEETIAEGNCGVRWALDEEGVMYFKAGRMSQTLYSELPDRGLVTEIRVVPTKEYSKLILP